MDELLKLISGGLLVSMVLYFAVAEIRKYLKM